MVDEALVKEVLTAEMVQAGKDLTIILDRTQLAISGSLWLYLPDKGIWRLLIASELVDSKGPRHVYRKIQSALRKSSDELGDISLNDISVVSPRTPLISALTRILRLPIGGGLRFSKNTVNGQFIEDAYIYKLEKS